MLIYTECLCAVCACVCMHPLSPTTLPRIGTLGKIMRDQSIRDWHRHERNVTPFTHSKEAKAAA